MDNEPGVVPEEQEVAAPVIEESQDSESDVESQDSSASSAEGSEESIQETADDTGKTAAIIAERERRQNAEARLKIIEEEINYYKSQQPQQQSKDPFDGLADDDIVQVGTVKEYLKGIEGKLTSEFQRQRIETSTKVAQGKYADYGNVVAKLPQLANETQIKIILSSNDPAEQAYRFVKSFDDSAKIEASKKIVDSVNQHLKKPNTLSKVGGGKSDPKSVVRNLSDKEFDQLVNGVTMGNPSIVKKYGY